MSQKEVGTPGKNEETLSHIDEDQDKIPVLEDPVGEGVIQFL